MNDSLSFSNGRKFAKQNHWPKQLFHLPRCLNLMMETTMIITSKGTARIDSMIMDVEKDETSKSIKCSLEGDFDVRVAFVLMPFNEVPTASSI